MGGTFGKSAAIRRDIKAEQSKEQTKTSRRKLLSVPNATPVALKAESVAPPPKKARKKLFGLFGGK